MSEYEYGIGQLLGKTLTEIVRSDDRLVFKADDGSEFVMYHENDCCESVYLEDVCGDLDDLIGSPILLAEEDSNSEEYPPDLPKPEYEDSFTWTFYRLATIEGGVRLRWYGSSNGYYSEGVTFERVNKE